MNIEPTVKPGGGSIMIQGWFAATEAGALDKVDSIGLHNDILVRSGWTSVDSWKYKREL